MPCPEIREEVPVALCEVASQGHIASNYSQTQASSSLTSPNA